ncbi:hypothetical protein Pmar_PMAR006936 [Perkinsus marinus ATCC 50983]|uniref:Uncharacterized protein n=1 Tax=Perkinsus marinus (strain ATCC 50983 / TXsc) TaxID=423536 RepID=C5KJU8_PERM5|nr:hypothetical protein Pmar_PMAR006936 [Perkinsus marinus ATCC 50983]EER15206.1 hypothetical protein Pmar_PMAR006936 [Perkinsus marinus ATCC 50983]|eukprot:XP_002783410.1 hypothetical protein Pmar_PMAR006936 [Perkinsus marinus ATCC 50983]
MVVSMASLMGDREFSARCSAVFDYDKLNELMRSICCNWEMMNEKDPKVKEMEKKARGRQSAGLVDKDHSMLFIEDGEIHIILAKEEHPEFDFSGAEFNGNVPSARESMDGVQYK